MDPITHGALGGVLAQAVLFNRNKSRDVWIAGALAAMAPDLDVFIRSSYHPMVGVLYHRYFTHALSFIPVGALLVTLGLLLFQRFRSQWLQILIAAFIGYATHGALDACTSYGTVLLWPFSNLRVSWDIVAIVDAFVTVPLILGLVWSLIFNQRLALLISLLWTGVFLSCNSWQHHRALTVAGKYFDKHGLSVSYARAFPSLASSTEWQVAAKTFTHQVLIGTAYTPLFKSSWFKFIKSLPLAPAKIKNFSGDAKDFKIFYWFSDGYVIALPNYCFADGRYTYTDPSLKALWGFSFPKHQPAQPLKNLILTD